MKVNLLKICGFPRGAIDTVDLKSRRCRRSQMEDKRRKENKCRVGEQPAWYRNRSGK